MLYAFGFLKAQTKQNRVLFFSFSIFFTEFFNHFPILRYWTFSTLNFASICRFDCFVLPWLLVKLTWNDFLTTLNEGFIGDCFSNYDSLNPAQPTLTFSNLTIETLWLVWNILKVNNKDTTTTTYFDNIILNIFHTLF